MLGAVVQAVAPVAKRVFVIRRREMSEPWEPPTAQIGEVLFDAAGDIPHPLWGVARALERTTTPYALVLSCDVPYVPTSFLRALVAHPDERGLVAAAGELVHPLIGLYPATMADSALAGASAGISMRAFARHCVRVQGESTWFTNINRLADLG
jgi:molybdopterin-guanine dinucleotide biosynthesis protein A